MNAIYSLQAWAYRRLYNELAWSYDAVAWLVSAGRWAQWRKLALEFLPPRGVILEVGFGTGALLAEVAQEQWQVYGIEPSLAMQRATARRLERHSVNQRAKRVRGVAQRMPFVDGTFDAIVATFPAEYVSSPDSASEFARILRRPSVGTPGAPGGRLIVNGLAVAVDNPRLAHLLPVFYGLPPAAVLDRWRLMLRQCGFDPHFVAQADRGVHVLSLVAERTLDD